MATPTPQKTGTTPVDVDYDQMLREYDRTLLNRQALGEYYALMQAMQEAETVRDFSNMLLYVEKTIPTLHAFVDNTKVIFRTFDIAIIPAIDVACRYWAVLGEREKLRQLKTVLEEDKDELNHWIPAVEAALEDADLADRVQNILKLNPGFVQNKLGKALGVSGRDTARIVATLYKLGKIHRAEDGKTYKLYVTET